MHELIQTIIFVLFLVHRSFIFLYWSPFDCLAKKDLAQLSVADVVFILLISNAVQSGMVGPDATLLDGLFAGSTLFVMNYFFKYLQSRFPRLGNLVERDAIMLVYKGRVLEQYLKKRKSNIG